MQFFEGREKEQENESDIRKRKKIVGKVAEEENRKELHKKGERLIDPGLILPLPSLVVAA